MVDKAAKKRVQDGIDRSRKAATKLRKAASKEKDPIERATLLEEANLYEREVRNLLQTCSDLGVK